MSQKKNILVRITPPQVKALIDLFDPRVRDPYEGAFNAQHGREEIVMDILERVPVRAVVETGTFRGTTTTWLASKFSGPIRTVEAHPRFFHYSKRRLRGFGNVEVLLSDSRAAIRQLGADEGFPSRDVLFYLDAHGRGELPLTEELRLISSQWRHWVAVVDDFAVPDDPGYEFDDYGEGQRVAIESIPPEVLAAVTLFFPKLPSSQETGFRRGCAVIAAGDASRALEASPFLRRW